MEKLTAAQANDLANNFLALAQSIGDFRYRNWSDLSESENKKLGDFQWSVLNSGEDILALSTMLVMEDVEGSLTKIRNVTNKIEATLKKLGIIQKAINIAVAAVTLGAAIISKNPQAIVDAIIGIENVLTELTEGNET